jgi:hypothetical protein
VVDADDTFVVAYRVRSTGQRGAVLVVGRSAGGERLLSVASLDKAHFGAESLERLALARTEAGRWRLYVSCATPGSKHWWIDLLEAADLEGLQGAEIRGGFGGDDHTGVKDPMIRRRGSGWEGWICCHPLDEPGEEDEMTTAYATSGDGVTWDLHGTVLAGRPGRWDARGARVTAVLPDGRASYDGRATKEENFRERTGRTARPAGSSPWATGPFRVLATSTSCALETEGTGSTTRPRCPTEATSFGPRSYLLIAPLIHR